jgi:hypothetical protein
MSQNYLVFNLRLRENLSRRFDVLSQLLHGAENLNLSTAAPTYMHQVDHVDVALANDL